MTTNKTLLKKYKRTMRKMGLSPAKANASANKMLRAARRGSRPRRKRGG